MVHSRDLEGEKNLKIEVPIHLKLNRTLIQCFQIKVALSGSKSVPKTHFSRLETDITIAVLLFSTPKFIYSRCGYNLNILSEMY